MKENKIIDFVREINGYVDYTILDYVNTGYIEALKFPGLIVFDDDNDGTEFFKQRSLSRLVKHLTLVLENTTPMLTDEIDKFFAQKKLELKEKFTNAKIKIGKIAGCRYKVIMSGTYNEDAMEQFIDVLVQDFEYIFEGYKMDYEF